MEAWEGRQLSLDRDAGLYGQRYFYLYAIDRNDRVVRVECFAHDLNHADAQCLRVGLKPLKGENNES